MITCGHCKQPHPSVDAVRRCAIRHHASRPRPTGRTSGITRTKNARSPLTSPVKKIVRSCGACGQPIRDDMFCGCS